MCLMIHRRNFQAGWMNSSGVTPPLTVSREPLLPSSLAASTCWEGFEEVLGLGFPAREPWGAPPAAYSLFMCAFLKGPPPCLPLFLSSLSEMK